MSLENILFVKTQLKYFTNKNIIRHKTIVKLTQLKNQFCFHFIIYLSFIGIPIAPFLGDQCE